MHPKKLSAHEKKYVGSPASPKQRLFNLMREKPGFAIAVAFSLLVILGVVYYLFLATGPDTDLQAMNKTNAKELYTQNKLMLAESVMQVQALSAANDNTPMDKVYFASIQKDLAWLAQKNEQVYSSRPTEVLIAKEIAFTTFLQRVYFVNQDFSYDTGSANYQYMIDYAAGKQVPVIVDANTLTDFYQVIDANEMLSLFYEDPTLESAFYTTTNTLITDYVAWERESITHAATIEEKYVESKKLVYFISNEQ